MRIVSVSQMVELEKEANEAGLSYEKMMERAGIGLGKIVHEIYYEHQELNALGLIGSGNNGGDTLVALTYLTKQGWNSRAYITKKRDAKDPLISEFLSAGGKISESSEDKFYLLLKQYLKSAHIILDGIFGTGIHLPLRGVAPEILKVVKSIKPSAKIIAVDCPSGMDCDTGETAAECLKADRTICMAAVKVGLLKSPAYKYTGELSVVDIGLPKTLQGWESVKGEVITRNEIQKSLPCREIDSHKGTFGTSLIIAGSVNFCGAPLLASKGAYKVGAGLIKTAIPGAIYDAIAGQLPETTWVILPHSEGAINHEAADAVFQNLDRVTSILIGPGFGLNEETQLFLTNLLQKSQEVSNDNGSARSSINQQIQKKYHLKVFPPMVVDADGLKLLKEIEKWWIYLAKNSVLTPHPGEMSIMTGLPIEKIQNSRIEIACEYARKWGHVIVLKGAMTVVAEPGGKYAVVPIATSALATAGTGDVLAGMISGYLAQGLGVFAAAKTAAWIHARAGQIAAEKIGNEASVLAGDIVEAIAQVIKSTAGI